ISAKKNKCEIQLFETFTSTLKTIQNSLFFLFLLLQCLLSISTLRDERIVNARKAKKCTAHAFYRALPFAASRLYQDCGTEISRTHCNCKIKQLKSFEYSKAKFY